MMWLGILVWFRGLRTFSRFRYFGFWLGFICALGLGVLALRGGLGFFSRLGWCASFVFHMI